RFRAICSCGTHPAQNKSKLDPARDSLVGLSAIGQCLKDHYDALASHLTSLHSLSNSKHKSRSAEPIGSLSVVATGDEWNRNTPAVHPRGRSAKLPGGLCVEMRASAAPSAYLHPRSSK